MRPLISYLPPVDHRQLDQRLKPVKPADEAPSGARKYVGAVAENYDAKRENSVKWRAEQNLVTDLLADLPAGTVVLDAPCGTGRFFPFYAERGFIVRGMDLSADMIKLAAAKVAEPTAMIGDHAQWMFGIGDVRGTSMPDKSVDVAVNVRVTRWLLGEHGPDGVKAMLKEMQRLARQRIIFTARVRNHPVACPYELISESLDGWHITKDISGGKGTIEAPEIDEDYRIVELRPA